MLEQTAMVAALATNGAGVSVVVGAAGTGKTHALHVAPRDVGTRRLPGDRVHARGPNRGRAPRPARGSRRAASTGSSARSTREGIDGLARRSIVVVDEAAMIGTRKLDRLLRQADRADAKVVLVGDHHQLPAIEAGGVFAALARQPSAIHLTENRRRPRPDRTRRARQLREGDTARALGILAAHGRVHDHLTKAARTGRDGRTVARQDPRR